MKQLLFFLMIGIMMGCNKDPNTGPVHTRIIDNGGLTVTQQNSAGVIVVNEGQFTRNNSSLSFIYSDSSGILNDVFYSKNQRDLGDVAQSVYRYKNNIYVIVNNAQKIEVANAFTFASVAVISGLTSPRYMAITTDGIAYVSDLYANGIWVVDLNKNELMGKVALHGWPEQMVIVNDDLFITEMNVGKLYKMSLASNTITDSLTLTKGPNSIVKDVNKKLWVLCDGGYHEQIPKLYRVDPVTMQVENSASFTLQDAPLKLSVNKSGDKLYYINKHVYLMDVSSNVLPSNYLVPSRNNQVFYGLGIAPDGRIYVGDAKDYQSRGMVYRYLLNGAFQDSLQAGVIPSYFCFR
jgi:sugar lactone lactonase YvrE